MRKFASLVVAASVVASAFVAAPALAASTSVNIGVPKCDIRAGFVRGGNPAIVDAFGVGTMCDKQFGEVNVKREDKGTPTRGPNMCILRVTGTKDSGAFSCIIPVSQNVDVQNGVLYFTVTETTPFAKAGQKLRYFPGRDRAL
ncbi:MAG: hypothetical protein DI628_02925 [Blastochloris viridis]|uniref:Secreted protein n=1 Tax=Blastochloris viridis TaxID=1079 RepID=A0A6N4RF07_BLAVI|nr:MAG: hypothetical protein DI628_02925 [Blastochloris viridis]